MKLAFLLLALCATKAAEAPWSVQRMVSMEYPLLAQQARIEEIVELSCQLGPKGEVAACNAVSGHPILRNAALDNERQYRFRRTVAGTVETEVRLRYEFALHGEGVRHRPKMEFAFEYPNRILVTSEIPCPDHLPCKADEKNESRKDRKRSKRKESIP